LLLYGHQKKTKLDTHQRPMRLNIVSTPSIHRAIAHVCMYFCFLAVHRCSATQASKKCPFAGTPAAILCDPKYIQMQQQMQQPKCPFVGEDRETRFGNAAGQTLACARAVNTTSCEGLSMSVAQRASMRSILEAASSRDRAGPLQGHGSFDQKRAREHTARFRGTASSVAVVSLCSGGYAKAGICKIAKDNFQNYCAHHGYHLMFLADSDIPQHKRKRNWGKVLAIKHALKVPGVEYVFWMDADSLFMDISRPLDHVLPPSGKEQTISGDSNCFINNGHLAFKRSPWSLSFLDQWWDVDPKPWPWQDQSSQVYLLSGKKMVCLFNSLDKGCCDGGVALPQVEIKSQHEMNSYTSNFQVGDFIIHFAGASLANKGMLMQNYVSMIGSTNLSTFDAALRDVVKSSLSKHKC